MTIFVTTSQKRSWGALTRKQRIEARFVFSFWHGEQHFDFIKMQNRVLLTVSYTKPSSGNQKEDAAAEDDDDDDDEKLPLYLGLYKQ